MRMTSGIKLENWEDKGGFTKAFLTSSGAETLNRSFSELLNLTIRQSTSFLPWACRRAYKTNLLLRSVCGIPRNAIGYSQVLLQLSETSSCFKVWPWNTHPNHPSRTWNTEVHIPWCVHFSCRINLDGKTRLNSAKLNGLIGPPWPKSQLMTEAPMGQWRPR